MLGAYYYTYGAGVQPNRKIEFLNPAGGKNISIQVSAYDDKARAWKIIYRLPNPNITFEELSTTEKVEKMMAARNSNSKFTLPYPIPVDQIPPKKLKNIFNNLEPNGPYRLAIRNDIGSDPTYEIIDKINIFNPS